MTEALKLFLDSDPLERPAASDDEGQKRSRGRPKDPDKPLYLEGGYSLKKLQAKHREMLRLLALGIEPADVAKALGVSYQTVLNVKNSELGQIHLEVLNGQRDAEITYARKKIESLAPIATEVLEEVLIGEKGDDKLQVAVAEGVLAKVGLGNISRTQAQNVNVNLDRKTLDDIIQEAKKEREEARRRAEREAQVIDYEEVSSAPKADEKEGEE